MSGASGVLIAEAAAGEGGALLLQGLAVLVLAGLVMVLGALLFGRLLRPAVAHPDKLEPYECGEPAIGSSWVQFNLRFYVVALVFLVFDIELALFWPWAVVFGGGSADPAAGRPAGSGAAGGHLGHVVLFRRDRGGLPLPVAFRPPRLGAGHGRGAGSFVRRVRGRCGERGRGLRPASAGRDGR